MRRPLVRLLSILMFTAVTKAQIIRTGTSTSPQVVPAATAAAQIARANALIQQAEQTPPPKKFELFAEAGANLMLVRKVWPNDKSAFLRSGIMQADLAAELGVWPQMVETLLEVERVAAKTDMEPQVEQKLGQAYDRMGNFAEAENHLMAAERAMHSAHSNRVQAQEILTSLATMYARQNKPQESILWYREAQNLARQNPINKVQFQLQIAEQAMQINRNAAEPELTHFDELVSAARQTTLTPADATLLNDMVSHAQRLRTPPKPH